MEVRTIVRATIGLIALAAVTVVALLAWPGGNADLPVGGGTGPTGTDAGPPAGLAALPPLPADPVPGPASANAGRTPPIGPSETPDPQPTGALRIDIEFPDGADKQPPRPSATLVIDGRGETTDREQAVRILADRAGFYVVAAPLPAGPVRCFLDLPGLASAGPLDAVVPANGEARIGPVRLAALGTLALTVAPAPSPETPAHLVVEPVHAATGSRQRQARAPAALVTLPNLPPGEYRVTVRSEGRAISTMSGVVVASAATSEYRIATAPEARLTVTIVDAAGDPPAPCYLRVRTDAGFIDQMADPVQGRVLRPIVALGGRCELRELPAGRIELQVSHLPAGPFVALGEVQVGEGDNAPVTFTWRE